VLAIWEAEDYHLNWAATLSNLGNALQNLPTNDRGVNLHNAIQCHEAALTVYNKDDYPTSWASTKNDLGSANLYLPTGDRGENLQKAIECYKAALKMQTRVSDLDSFTGTSYNLALAYLELQQYSTACQCFKDAADAYRSIGMTANAEKLERIIAKIDPLI
jgi:tetratricopeptide (TPR) repeat protein